MKKQVLTVTDLERVLGKAPKRVVRRQQQDLRYQIADLLLQIRSRAGLSQRQLARRAAMSQPEVSRLERAGGLRSPGLWTLVQYATACGFRLRLGAQSSTQKKGQRAIVTSLGR